MGYQKIKVPTDGTKITVNADHSLNVPDHPIIPYIEGDGIGVDVSPVMIKVVDAAVQKAYGGKRKIAWMEVYAGEKATQVYDQDTWLPQETLDAVRDYVVSIKGPLTTPVGGGIRSLNVALRQQLDLYVCLRPVLWFQGVQAQVLRSRPGRSDHCRLRPKRQRWGASGSRAAELRAHQDNLHAAETPRRQRWRQRHGRMGPHQQQEVCVRYYHVRGAQLH